MNHRTLLTLLLTPLALAACADQPKPQTALPPTADATPTFIAYFAPDAAPRFVTIEREPIYAIIPDDTRDLIAFRAVSVSKGRPTGASITCFINVPADAPLDTPFHLAGEDAPVRGWAIVDTPNVERRVAPLTGGIVILARDEESLTAAVDIAVADDDRVPSITGAAAASRTPRRDAIATPALATRSGVGHAPPPPKPERRKTESTWPWAEIMGDYPPPKPNYSTRGQPPSPIRN